VKGSEPLVEVEHLVKHYGEFMALDHVSFELREGVSTGLLGPNGAGKTTLMKTLLGFLPSTSGSFRVLGHSPHAAPLAVRRLVGFMPENEAFFPALTGLEAVVLAGRLTGMPREDAFSRAYEVLDFLGMDEVRHRPVSGYSVGLKQKVKLAQAVVHGPRLLMLDEPLSGLDPQSRDEMMGLLTGIAGSGVAMVVSSHVLPDVEALCSSVLMLDQGKLLYAGSLEDLRHRDRGRFRIRCKGNTSGMVEALKRRGAKVNSGRAGLDVLLPADQAVELIWQAAVDCRCQVRELRPASDSLETAFLRLLGKED